MIIRSTLSVLSVITLFFANGLTAAYQGRYTNEDYGFEVTIPAGYTGRGAAVYAPNHGFVVTTQDGSTVSVDASYDTIVGPSGEGFEQQMTRLNGPPVAILGGLRAWKSTGTAVRKGRRVVERGIIARRVSEEGDAIIYTISESADEGKRGAADRLFEELVASFRVIPIAKTGRR
jgi:hypothetical protein